VSILTEQIAKAQARQGAVDIARAAEEARGKAPAELATEKQKAERLNFIEHQDLPAGDSAIAVFERIIAGNEIQDVNYLARGARVAQAIGRITIKDEVGRTKGWGTGFLVAPGVLLTNNHVLPSAAIAARSYVEFEYELDITGTALKPARFELEPQRLFYTKQALDFAVVATRAVSAEGGQALEDYGFLPLVQVTGKVADGEWLTIVQHPNGERKQLCVRENKLIKRTDDALWYSTDTLGGSSGSPVFNNEWYVVALHHSGIPETKDGKIQTRTGVDYDPSRHDELSIKWIANEGIRVSRIVQTLRAELPQHDLLRPMFEAAPEYTALQLLPAAAATRRRLNPEARTKGTTSMTQDSSLVTVTLALDRQGGVRIVDAGQAITSESMLLEKARPKNTLDYDAPFNARYDDRNGFGTKFLGDKFQVNLPTLNRDLELAAAPLLDQSAGNEYVLHYHNYSLVMHATRRLAIYTAANVDFGGRWDMSRPPDVWRTDPRISSTAQIGDFYYRSNKFDRGHLTRREDLEFGSTYKKALVSAADTCHWTNCTPQHERFNQNKQLWQGIERHILEQAIEKDEFKAQVFTGPFLDEDDPVYEKFPQIQYPIRFWKVVVAVNSEKKLFATAYILDQSGVIGEFGIEVAPEIPFSAYKTFQVPIAEVERLTGLTFTSGSNGKERLATVDPFSKMKKVKAKKFPTPLESMAAAEAPANYVPLVGLESIVVG
jgi:endonuclease G